jgi:hypothetical protein
MVLQNKQVPKLPEKHSFTENLGTFSADTTSQLDILGHNSHTLGVNGTQVGIFEKTNKVGLRGFLEGEDGRGLETEVGLKVLSNLTNKTLEGGLCLMKSGGRIS